MSGDTEHRHKNGGWRRDISPMETRLYGLIIAGALGASPLVQALRDEEPRALTIQLTHINQQLTEVKDEIKEGNRQYVSVNQRVNAVESRVSVLEAERKGNQ